ncbi:unnamed protein product [Polarella glacialis]|uniref:dolichyl-diphosphooligosaccharide--protein glycotransferase n=2 Tax=Polarella glacialis TaxID=89957 RepID=A0A813DCC0_POLGL|nr:unnamed protein product [Polarella glacialis]
MAILPAHLSRSVGGGFDNESVAIPAMCITFFLWCRSLRTASSWPLAAAAGLAYTCMAASWGGYVFVLNMVGVHAGVLLLLGRSQSSLCKAYTLFYVIGTTGAMQVPIIGWTPLKSSEQLGPLAIFAAMQLAQLYRAWASRCSSTQGKDGSQLATVAILGAVAALAVAVLVPSGFFGPLSVRVSALFVEHTRTGNPLVDSVAEHQPGSSDAYWTYLGKVYYVAPAGLPALFLRKGRGVSDSGLFLVCLAGAAYFFSLKMRRLIILTALPAAGLTGVAAGLAFEWVVLSPIQRTLCSPSSLEMRSKAVAAFNTPLVRIARLLLAALLAQVVLPEIKAFYEFCDNKARYSLSHPQIMLKANNGGIIDDYREAYWWLRDNTPEDSRIMAWWDYGYQIAGIAKRTTIADGNTWNHEHIALLGLCLSSPVQDAHTIARHLADYILVWSGGGGKDDVGKSGHMARIANSVYSGHCAESDCDQFGIYPGGKASKMMGSSLIYSLCDRGGALDEKYFKEVYHSRNKRVRIVQVLRVSEESRQWAGDPRNRLCDAPGSWYCPGQYPPLLRQLVDEDLEAETSEAKAYRKAYAKRKQEQEAERPLPNQPGLPGGSFLDSCRGCSLEGKHLQKGVLRCTHCRFPGSPALASSLDLQSCPLPEVDNIRGELQCKPKVNAANIPEGGYRDSCRGCELEQGGTVLQCSHCGAADGRRVTSRFLLSQCPRPGKLDNHNGVLNCVGLLNAAKIPEGPYLHSCQGCHLFDYGKLVTCQLCRKADGRQLQSSFELGLCLPPGKLDNQDGSLICKGGKSPGVQELPEGPYKQTCSECRLEGPRTLKCERCGNLQSQVVSSSYDLSRCSAPAQLHNQDGALICIGVPSGPRLPAGNYLKSCEGCHLQEGDQLLSCSHCKAPGGLQRVSSYQLALCPVPGRLENWNGVLNCLGLLSGPAVPGGAFRESCQGCRLESSETGQGQVLTCSHCRAADGRQKPSSLALAGCPDPAQMLQNRDGSLICGQ